MVHQGTETGINAGCRCRLHNNWVWVCMGQAFNHSIFLGCRLQLEHEILTCMMVPIVPPPLEVTWWSKTPPGASGILRSPNLHNSKIYAGRRRETGGVLHTPRASQTYLFAHDITAAPSFQIPPGVVIRFLSVMVDSEHYDAA